MCPRKAIGTARTAASPDAGSSRQQPASRSSAACGNSSTTTTTASTIVTDVTSTLVQPATRLSGDLKILQWSHFVPRHDTWFDPFAKDWGTQVGVNVSVDHINQAELLARAAAEISAGEGHDLIEFIFPPASLEKSVLRPDRPPGRGGEALRRAGRPVHPQHLQPRDRQVLRVLPRLGPRPRRLPQEPVGEGRAARTAPPPTRSCSTAAAASRPSRASSSASACRTRSTPTWPPGP